MAAKLQGAYVSSDASVDGCFTVLALETSG